VEVVLRGQPVIDGHDEIALDAVRSGRRRRRQLSGVDSVGPLGQTADVPAVRGVEGADGSDHGAAARARLKPSRPRLDRRALRRFEGHGKLASGLVAELMTVAAPVELHGVEPLLLAPECHRHAVTVGSRAGEQALVGDLEHGEPIDGRVVLGRRRGAGRGHRSQVHDAAARRLDLRRVDEAVAAHPHTVARGREVRDHVPAAVVGDHDLREPGPELGGLRDDPDTGLRPILAGDDPSDVPGADLHSAGCVRLSRRPGRQPGG
jgi:hypothetical protein